MIRIRFLGFALRHLSFRTPWFAAAVYRLLAERATTPKTEKSLYTMTWILPVIGSQKKFS
jgi:hypothetical protein